MKWSKRVSAKGNKKKIKTHESALVGGGEKGWMKGKFLRSKIHVVSTKSAEEPCYPFN